MMRSTAQVFNFLTPRRCIAFGSAGLGAAVAYKPAPAFCDIPPANLDGRSYYLPRSPTLRERQCKTHFDAMFFKDVEGVKSAMKELEQCMEKAKAQDNKDAYNAGICRGML